jgi:hypothetical protein
MKKTCAKCGIEKNVTEFSKSAYRKDGLQIKCKACDKKYRTTKKEKIASYLREYRNSHKNKASSYAKNYRKNNNEALRKKDKLKYKKNREKILARIKKYYEMNLEEKKRYAREYYEINKDKLNFDKKNITKSTKTNWLLIKRLGEKQIVLKLQLRMLNDDQTFFKQHRCGQI